MVWTMLTGDFLLLSLCLLKNTWRVCQIRGILGYSLLMYRVIEIFVGGGVAPDIGGIGPRGTWHGFPPPPSLSDACMVITLYFIFINCFTQTFKKGAGPVLLALAFHFLHFQLFALASQNNCVAVTPKICWPSSSITTLPGMQCGYFLSYQLECGHRASPKLYMAAPSASDCTMACSYGTTTIKHKACWGKSPAQPSREH